MKRRTIGLLRRLIRPPPVAPVPDWTQRPHRILFLRYDHIGDMILVTGILHAIKQAQPTLTIDVLASRRNASVLDGNPDVQIVYRVTKNRPWTFLVALARIRRMHYDAVLDSMVTGPSLTSALIMWASGARNRIGVAHRGNDFALTVPVPRIAGATHYVEHSAALLQPFGITPVPRAAAGGARGESSLDAMAHRPAGRWPPRIWLRPEEIAAAEAFWQCGENSVQTPGGMAPRRRLAVNISAESPWRQWPEERYIAAIQRLRQRFPDLRVLILGAPVDESRKRTIGAACAVRIDETASAREMMALVATCDYVLTPDTAVTHVASAFGKPVVALFAGVGGSHWGPYATAGTVVATPARSLASLGVDPVVQALEALMADELDDTPPAAAGMLKALCTPG